MKPPEFWNKPPQESDLRKLLLRPLGALYARATQKRLQSGTPHKLDIPVICVGNLNAGGTGKTPTVIWLVQTLQNMGHTPVVLSRGYGGKLEGPILVDPNQHGAADVGDEPLLIAAFTTVCVSKDRAAGAKMAEKSGATVLIMDDGFQNPSVYKDFSIIVVDAQKGFGNGHCMPAGPLREPVPEGMKRADLVLSIGRTTAQDRFSELWQHHIPIAHAKGWLAPLQTGMMWQGTRFLAFAGIGHPEKFFATLRALGADVVKSEALDDHQPLSAPLMARLENEAKLLSAQLVTTEKDAVRLPDSFRMKVLTLPVRLDLFEEAGLSAKLKEIAPPPN